MVVTQRKVAGSNPARGTHTKWPYGSSRGATFNFALLNFEIQKPHRDESAGLLFCNSWTERTLTKYLNISTTLVSTTGTISKSLSSPIV